jgi:hypothetical protein
MFSCILSNHNGIQLEINHKRKYANIGSLKKSGKEFKNLKSKNQMKTITQLTRTLGI